jgi:hypothetical protein
VPSNLERANSDGICCSQQIRSCERSSESRGLLRRLAENSVFRILPTLLLSINEYGYLSVLTTYAISPVLTSPLRIMYDSICDCWLSAGNLRVPYRNLTVPAALHHSPRHVSAWVVHERQQNVDHVSSRLSLRRHTQTGVSRFNIHILTTIFFSTGIVG